MFLEGRWATEDFSNTTVYYFQPTVEQEVVKQVHPALVASLSPVRQNTNAQKLHEASLWPTELGKSNRSQGVIVCWSPKGQEAVLASRVPSAHSPLVPQMKVCLQKAAQLEFYASGLMWHRGPKCWRTSYCKGTGTELRLLQSIPSYLKILHFQQILQLFLRTASQKRWGGMS